MPLDNRLPNLTPYANTEPPLYVLVRGCLSDGQDRVFHLPEPGTNHRESACRRTPREWRRFPITEIPTHLDRCCTLCDPTAEATHDGERGTALHTLLENPDVRDPEQVDPEAREIRTDGGIGWIDLQANSRDVLIAIASVDTTPARRTDVHTILSGWRGQRYPQGSLTRVASRLEDQGLIAVEQLDEPSGPKAFELTHAARVLLQERLDELDALLPLQPEQEPTSSKSHVVTDGSGTQSPDSEGVEPR